MDENKLLDKIIELTRENERLKIQLEKYGECAGSEIPTGRKRRTEDVGIASEERFRNSSKEEIVKVDENFWEKYDEIFNPDNFKIDDKKKSNSKKKLKEGLFKR